MANNANVRGVSNPTTKPAETTEQHPVVASKPEPIAVTATISRPNSQSVYRGRKAGTSFLMLAQTTVMIGEIQVQIPVWMSAAPTSDGSGLEITPSVGSLPRGMSVPDDLKSKIDSTIEQTIAAWSDWDAACERAETLLTRKPEPAGKTASNRLAPRLVKPVKPEASAPAPA